MGRNPRKRSSRESTANPKPEKRKRNNSGLGDANVNFDWLTEQNTSYHHTDEYENEVLVVRRGGKINLGMTFEGIKFSEIMGTSLRFCIEPKPRNFKDQFYIHCGIQDKTDDSKWGMKVLKKDPSKLQIFVEINVPVDTVIGRYSVHVVVPGFSIKSLNQSQIIILFNPWNKDDDVYLNDEGLSNEYVLNDKGVIYRRPTSSYGLDWNFGQFEEDILDCVLQLLEKDKRVKRSPLRSFKNRNSPVWVARVLSAVLNSQDDDGVLVGNWSGDYADGVSPTSWSGSVDILRQYFTTGKPVEYGQCWVFSGIMTTALRTLGIPARSVTNFDSAHDTDNTMTIDAYYNEDGDRLGDISDDSVWNFHVWNEIWTKRNDLPEGYDGWQAVDSTPQEESSQLYQMGPAPLNAVKNGEIYAGFDTGFVFSEVNADAVDWVVKQDEEDEIIVQKVKRVNPTRVGHHISTKRVGTDEREYITHLYKHSEGSQDEEKAFRTAYSYGHGAKKFVGHLGVEKEGEHLTLDLSTTHDGIIPNGDSITCKINVKNTSKQKCTVKLTGVISSIQYTGKVKVLVKRKKFDHIKVDAGKTVSQEIHVDADEYLDKLTDLNCLKLVVVAKVIETGKQYVDDIKFQLSNKDCINVKFLESSLKVGERSKVDITFTNPLPITMSGVKFSIEGAGLTRLIRRSYKRRLGSGRKRTVRFTFTPRKPGIRTLLVDIDSSQAKDFKAVASVKVVDA